MKGVSGPNRGEICKHSSVNAVRVTMVMCYVLVLYQLTVLPVKTSVCSYNLMKDPDSRSHFPVGWDIHSYPHHAEMHFA